MTKFSSLSEAATALDAITPELGGMGYVLTAGARKEGERAWRAGAGNKTMAKLEKAEAEAERDWLERLNAFLESDEPFQPLMGLGDPSYGVLYATAQVFKKAEAAKAEAAKRQEVQVGDRVRSFDFDDHALEGERACYFEGRVESIVDAPDCKRYVIRTERQVFQGVEVPATQRPALIYPPMNGIKRMFGGVTTGVEKL